MSYKVYLKFGFSKSVKSANSVFWKVSSSPLSAATLSRLLFSLQFTKKSTERITIIQA